MIDKIKELIYKYAPDIDMVYEDENLYERGISSLDLLMVILDIEKMFNIHISDEEIVDIRNINDISDLVSQKNQ